MTAKCERCGHPETCHLQNGCTLCGCGSPEIEEGMTIVLTTDDIAQAIPYLLQTKGIEAYSNVKWKFVVDYRGCGKCGVSLHITFEKPVDPKPSGK